MGLRFRRSIKICPGVRLNFSKSGISTTVGGKGFTMTSGSRGTYVNAGLPGTGISVREKIGGTSPKNKISSSSGQGVTPSININELSLQAEAINVTMDEYNNVALLTPEIDDVIEYQIQSFPEPMPSVSKSLRAVHYFIIGAIFFLATFASDITLGIAATVVSAIICKVIASKNAQKEQDILMPVWQKRKDEFLAAENAKYEVVKETLDNNISAPEEAFGQGIDLIDWPYETEVSYEVDGNTLKIDVDLPEIEDLDNHKVVIKGRGKNRHLETIEKSDRQSRLEYARHIHGIGMVLAGVAFNILDDMDNVIISAYSQRLSTTTGNWVDEYLYSVKIPRQGWLNINLQNKDKIDPVALLGSFEIRRKMTSTGIFKPIAPFEEGKVNSN